MKTWYQLTVCAEQNQAESLADLLQAYACSVSLSARENEEVFQYAPEDVPLWQHTEIQALFETTQARDEAKILLENTLDAKALRSITVREFEDKDWVSLTQAQFQPMCFGETLWVCPSWHDAENLSGVVLKLDPGQAFGTGTHPTTAMCLTYLATHLNSAATVVDYGSGSGILSLAALCLGAKSVLAVDHDPQALAATERNAAANNLAMNLRIAAPNDVPNMMADLVVANILANPLITLAPTLTALTKPSGCLVLSGILTAEVARVFAAYAADYVLVDQVIEGEWAMLVLKATS